MHSSLTYFIRWMKKVNLGTWMIGLILGIGILSGTSFFALDGFEDDLEDPDYGIADEGYPEEQLTEQEGEELYQQSCAACHAIDLKGASGPDLTKIGQDKTEEEIEEIVINGEGAMPGAVVNDDQAKVIATWLVEETE